MEKILIQFLICILLFQLHVTAQQPIDEEKVKKAIVLQKKMMQNPGEMMSIMEEIKALKLNSAEDKEVRNRMTKASSEIITKGKEQAMQMGGITQEQIDKQKEAQNRIVPVRDAARINAVLKRTLTDAEIKNYCKAVHEAVKKQMNTKAIEQAEKFYREIQSKYSSPAARGNGAISCYLTNLTLQSIYIMGRVCSEEAFDANNINNYAALLTNHGVEQGAIPMLMYLRSKYDKNPIVLSNIALAWMGLGELKTAEKYADSCIRYFPGHSHQAQYVKCIVEESKGNRQGAVSQLQQSIGQVYSAEKESMLRKMGGKMNSSHIKKTFPADALGLSKFNFPAFPMKYETAIEIQPEWQTFYKNLEPLIAELDAKSKKLTAEMNNHSKEKAMQMINKAAAADKRPGYFFAANNNIHQGWTNYFNTLVIEYSLKEEKILDEYKELQKKDSALMKEMYKEAEAIGEKYDGFCGEGQTCPEEEICNAYKAAYNKYMEAINSLLEPYFINYISFKRKSTNELVYAAKYSIPDELEYERFKTDRQRDFLGTLKNVKFRRAHQAVMFGNFSSACLNVKTNPFKSKGLQRFEDIHCGNKWEANFPFSSLSTDCNKITLKLDFIVGEFTKTDDLFTGEWTNMGIEVGINLGTKKFFGSSGKEVFEAGLEGGEYIEIDRTGVTDWGVKGKAGVSGGDRTIIGAEGKVSIMSGKSSFDVKSDLSKVFVTYK